MAGTSATTADASISGIRILLADPESIEGVVQDEGWAMRQMALDARADQRRGRPSGTPQGYRIERGAALVPVLGSLMPRGPVGMAARNMTSYSGLRAELRRAVAEPAVAAVVLTIDSPGGTVSGVDVAADAILRARRVKPVLAMVEGQAASAAYWLASQCGAIVVAPLGTVGSIGVVRVHVDVSRAMDAAGVKVTLLHAGARKVDGNPYEPLADGPRAGMRAQLETVRLAFAKAVAASRAKPQLDAAAVLATEARMVDARQAVHLGLADQVGTLDDLLAGRAGVRLPPSPSSSSTAPARKPAAVR